MISSRKSVTRATWPDCECNNVDSSACSGKVGTVPPSGVDLIPVTRLASDCLTFSQERSRRECAREHASKPEISSYERTHVTICVHIPRVLDLIIGIRTREKIYEWNEEELSCYLAVKTMSISFFNFLSNKLLFLSVIQNVLLKFFNFLKIKIFD